MKKSLLLLAIFIGLVSGYYIIDSRIVDRYNAIKNVKSHIYPMDKTAVFENVVKQYQYFNDITWDSYIGSRGEIIVKMKTMCDINKISDVLKLSNASRNLADMLIYVNDDLKFCIDATMCDFPSMYKEWIKNFQLYTNSLILEIDFIMNPSCSDIVEEHGYFIINGIKSSKHFNFALSYVYSNKFCKAFHLACFPELENLYKEYISKTSNGYYYHIEGDNIILLNVHKNNIKYVKFNKMIERISDRIYWNQVSSENIHNVGEKYDELDLVIPQQGDQKKNFRKVFPDILLVERKEFFAPSNIFIKINDKTYEWYDREIYQCFETILYNAFLGMYN